ncbi:MAG: PEP-CTERM system TPR-repeat protein PrsT, partial [Chitinophagaceae bacterium]|nr:PEP-CTERM system TPR-repeat protein PrsT [Rubrivivax sp.]
MLRRTFAALCLTAAAAVLPACFSDSESALIKSATTSLGSKQYSAAIIHLKSALQKNPNSAEARLLLGQALNLSGDPASAVLELRKARDLKAPEDRVAPELARALLATGDPEKVVAQFSDMKLVGGAAADVGTSVATAQLLLGNTEKAAEALDRALQADAKFSAALTLKARMAAGQGELDGALALLDGVLSREPGHVGAGTLKGDILRLAKKDPAAALEAYRQVLSAHPQAVVAHAAMMNILILENRKDDAKKQLTAMKQVAPNHPETWFYEAQIAFSDQDYKTVRDLTDRILKVAPNNARVLELAGAAEYRRKAYAQAEVMLSQALKIAPGQLVSRHLLAQTYLRSGQPEKAAELVQPMLASGQADVASLSLAGEAYLQMGDAKRAEAVFQQAAKAAPDNARVRTAAAVAQLAQGGNNAAAISTLEGIAAEDKGPRADLAVISAKLRSNDIGGALKAVDALQKKQPDQPLSHLLRGRILMLQRDAAGARTSFEAALAKDSQYFPAAAGLSALDLAAGQPDLARKRLQDLLTDKPGNQQAKLALAELSARTGAPPAEVSRQLAEAVKINPNEPRAHLLLINQLLAASESRAALSAAQAATAALPNNTELIDALGRAQMSSGDSQQAVSTLRRLV